MQKKQDVKTRCITPISNLDRRARIVRSEEITRRVFILIREYVFLYNKNKFSEKKKNATWLYQGNTIIPINE